VIVDDQVGFGVQVMADPPHLHGGDAAYARDGA
jgi:hypothetical protein